MNRGKLIFFLLFSLVGVCGPSQAQTLLLNNDRIEELTSPFVKEGIKITVVSGKQVRDHLGPTTKEEMETLRPLGRASKLFYALTALAMADADMIDLDKPILRYLPDLGIDEFFTVSVTARHLIAETAGFSVPPWHTGDWVSHEFAEMPLSHYVKSLRTAGQMTHDDPVSTMVLVSVLESVSGKNITDLINEYINRPLGLPSNSFTVEPRNEDAYYPALFNPIYNAFASQQALAKITQLMLKNKAADGSAFLSAERYQDFVDEPSFAFHPMGMVKTSGLKQLIHQNRLILASNTKCDQSIMLATVPRHSIGFIVEKSPQSKLCSVDVFRQLLDRLAGEDLPPLKNYSPTLTNRLAIEQRLKEPEGGLNGIYIIDDAPTRHLKKRLDRIKNQTLIVNPAGTNRQAGVITIAHQGIKTEFMKQAAYRYRSADGEELIFTPYKLGGYISYRDHQYRYVGLLGDKHLIISPFQWSFILLLSTIIYWRSKTGVQWRRMARIGLFSSICLGSGLYLELTYWSEAYFTMGNTWIIILWRMLINIGLMGTLAIPMLIMAFSKRKIMPTGNLALIISPHLTLITAASLILFFLTIAWGIAGELSP